MPRQKNLMVDLKKVDWRLLRWQKQVLLDLRQDVLTPNGGNLIVAGRTEGSIDSLLDALLGVIRLLDDIQDQAATTLGSDEVFGDLSKFKEDE